MIESRLTKEAERREWIRTGEKILITGFSGLVGFGIAEAAFGKDRLIGFARRETESAYVVADKHT